MQPAQNSSLITYLTQIRTNTERKMREASFYEMKLNILSAHAHIHKKSTQAALVFVHSVVLMSQTVFVYLNSKCYDQTAREGQNALKITNYD